METDEEVEVEGSARGVTDHAAGWVSLLSLKKMAFPKDTGQTLAHKPTRWRLGDVVQ